MGAAEVLVCALGLLGRGPETFPPIHIVGIAPAAVSAHAEAYVRRDPDGIYLIASAPAFREALSARQRNRQCQPTPALKKIASMLIHEEWHLRHGADERGAYFAQLNTLAMLGETPDRPLYHGVRLAMLAALKAQETGERLARAW